MRNNIACMFITFVSRRLKSQSLCAFGAAISALFLFSKVPVLDSDFFFNGITKPFLINFYRDPQREIRCRYILFPSQINAIYQVM